MCFFKNNHNLPYAMVCRLIPSILEISVQTKQHEELCNDKQLITAQSTQCIVLYHVIIN